jgi:hypothetical protein
MIDGKLNPTLDRDILSEDEKIRVKWVADDIRHSIYIRVWDKDGKLVLVGNPIYIDRLI